MSTARRSLTSNSNHPRGVFTGVPSFIRAHCRTASRGGISGYAEAGFQLGGSVRQLEPLDIEEEEWLATLDTELAPLLEGTDDEPLIAWLDRRYPRILALVPMRRRAGFAAGFRRGFDAED